MPPALPWAVAPYFDEWLGFWLHRVGEPYGLQVRDLLAYAGAADRATTVPTWARLPPFSAQNLNRLSELLREPAASLERMQQLVSPLRRTGQAGYCWCCLTGDVDAQHAPCWRRNWMDAYSGWCQMHRVCLVPIDASEPRRLSTASSIGALMRSLTSTRPAPADQDDADMTVALDAPIALQAALRDEAARTIQQNVFGYRSLRQRVDRVADAPIQELWHGRPIDTAFGRLAGVAPEPKLPIAWSPLPSFGGLLCGVRAQWQRVTLLSVAAHVLHEKPVLGQPQHTGQESVVQCSDMGIAAIGRRIDPDRKYSTAPIGLHSVASYRRADTMHHPNEWCVSCH